MLKVLNVKPRNGLVLNVKPRLSKIYGEVIRWKNTGRGMPIGLLLALTYPNDQKEV